MKKINIKLNQEQVNQLSNAHKGGDFAEFNKKFAEITNLIQVSRLTDKMEEISANLEHYKEVIDLGLGNLGKNINTDPKSLETNPEINKNNLEFLSNASSYGIPDMLRVSKIMGEDFKLLRTMLHSFDAGNRFFIRRYEKFDTMDNGINYFTTEKAVSNFILSIYNISVNFKSQDSELEK